MTSSLIILTQEEMALIILRYVILTVVFYSMTSHATVSRTYKVAMNTTGSEVCAVDQPTTVIPMAASAMAIHCGVQCNEVPTCKMFQMKEDLKQCELFNYVPSNLAADEHCTAYAASLRKHMFFLVWLRIWIRRTGTWSPWITAVNMHVGSTMDIDIDVHKLT